MKKMFTFIALLLSLSSFAQLNDKIMSFDGNATIKQVTEGSLTKTIRLGDRTQAPYLFKVSSVLSIVNSNVTEETRSVEEQVKIEAYKFVELTQLTVSKLTDLSAAEQTEFRKFYTQERIDQAKGIVSVITFKFKNTK